LAIEPAVSIFRATGCRAQSRGGRVSYRVRARVSDRVEVKSIHSIKREKKRE